ncbi:MAG: heparan-alpha-glucosaminide N-acetyltransferase domain-containing protein [Planctomycetota bacterium]|jgi:uncharacterized membrane protein
MRRLASVDVLRAIAILLMIQVHFVYNLSPREASTAALYDLSIVLGVLPAPIFTFLVGLSLWLWLRREVALGRSELELSKVIIRRGLFLFGAGLAFAVFVWSPKEVFDWDILTLIGASTLILFTLRKLAPEKLVALAILVLLISPPLRTATGYASHWRGEEYIYTFTMRDVVLGFLLQGYFPLLPWIVFPLIGFATGKHYLGDELGQRLRGWRILVVGMGLVGLAGLGSCFSDEVPQAVSGYISELSFYPASTTFIFGTLGVTLLGLWALYRGLDSREILPGGAVLSFFSRYSRFSLTTYIMHHVAHLWPLYLLATWKGEHEPSSYYRKAVSTPVAFVLALLFIAGFHVVLVVLERRRKYNFEAFLRWLSEA